MGSGLSPMGHRAGSMRAAPRLGERLQDINTRLTYHIDDDEPAERMDVDPVQPEQGTYGPLERFVLVKEYQDFTRTMFGHLLCVCCLDEMGEINGHYLRSCWKMKPEENHVAKINASRQTDFAQGVVCFMCLLPFGWEGHGQGKSPCPYKHRPKDLITVVTWWLGTWTRGKGRRQSIVEPDS